jgi:hypothetical protein
MRAAPSISSLPPGTDATGAESLTLADLIDEVSRAHLVIDARLTRPASWSGSTRKEVRRGAPLPEERRAVAAAFDEAAGFWSARADPADLDVTGLLRLHRLVGGSGEFRQIPVSVGGFRDAAHRDDVPDLAETALARAHDGVDHPVLAAARLHVELLLIHPFNDGNGRTARLASSWLLMRAGFKSTLLTAVEQHGRVEHQRYIDAFDTLRLSKPTAHRAWLVTNLEMMAAGVRWAVWYRTRENRLREVLRAAGVRQRTHDSMLLDFDLGRDGSSSPLLDLAPDDVGLRALVRTMPEADRAALSHQIRRLVTEESEDEQRRSRP